MNALNKIEKLILDNDGLPNQDLIDYRVDQMVEKMIQDILGSDSGGLSSLVDNKKDLDIPGSCHFKARQKYFWQLEKRVRQSIDRYYPYVKMSSEKNIAIQTHSHKNSEEEVIIFMHFPATFLITPQMKETLPLKNKLEQNLENKENNKNILKI